MTNRKIAPDAIVALKRALTTVYWYKNDLRSFLTTSLRNPHLLSRINWSDTKRDIVGVLVDEMEWNQQRYGDDLVKLMFDVAKVNDFAHLTRLEDGAAKAQEARDAVAALKTHLEGHEEILRERSKSEELRNAAGLHPNFPPVISRVRRLFRPSWGVSFVVLVSSSSQFFRPPFTL